MPSREPRRNCLVTCEKFGRQAEYFESAVVPLWQDVYDTFIARADLRRGARVLDVGTGTGEVALRAAAAVGPEGSVLGIDPMKEMLRIARRKAGALHVANLEFKQMALEGLLLPDSSFDSVVGNYALCCASDYEVSLREILRVMKPGGRLTYNHGGPSDPEAAVVIFDAFEGYKTRNPTKRLQEFRDSEAAQNQAVKMYRDPQEALALLRKLGFDSPGSATVKRSISYRKAIDFVDRMLAFDWRLEAEEIPKKELEKFRTEASKALEPMSQGRGFGIVDETVFFTAYRR